MHKKAPSMQSDDHQTAREELRDRSEEYLNGWKRAVADLDNYKKQIAKNLDEERSRQIVAIFDNLLPLYDMYREALKHVPEHLRHERWYEGFQHLVRQWDSLLREYDIVALNSHDAHFDPAIHEAVSVSYDASRPDNTVVETFKDGYTYRDRLIRPASVKVNMHTQGLDEEIAHHAPEPPPHAQEVPGNSTNYD